MHEQCSYEHGLAAFPFFAENRSLKSAWLQQMNELCRFDRRHIQCGAGNGLDASSCGKALLPIHISARLISAPLTRRRRPSRLSRTQILSVSVSPPFRERRGAAHAAEQSAGNGGPDRSP